MINKMSITSFQSVQNFAEAQNILDQLILPRIQKEVDSWNPLTDLIPIHAWIHPWLPRLGSAFILMFVRVASLANSK